MANRFTYYESPLGTVTLQANNEGLLGVWCEKVQQKGKVTVITLPS